MVNQIIIDYLNSYKDKYPIEGLKKEIISKGYTEEDFNEALTFVTGSKSDENFGKDLEKIGKWKIPEPENNKKEKPQKTKKKMSKAKVILLIFFVLLLLGIFSIIALNYIGISFFGFNLFDYLI